MTILTSLKRNFSTITSDSRQVKKGALFLAYPGALNDGRNYIEKAIESGASAVIWEKNDFDWQPNWKVSNIGINNLKSQVGEIAAEYYDFPSRKLIMIGVTGTNGKTSVSQWIAQSLTTVGKKVAILGTIGNGIFAEDFDPSNDGLKEAANTTPDAILLQKMLSNFLKQNVEMVVMEVSSHGLDQGRVNGVKFDVAILTNLSRDHLDYHQTMEVYAEAKRKLFVRDDLQVAILNADDPFGKQLINELNDSTLKHKVKKVISFGLESGDIRGQELKLSNNGLKLHLNCSQGTAQISAQVLGRFNAYNLLAVFASLIALDVSISDAVAAISQIKPVKGRMQQFGGGKLPLVIVDYAHTPDALENVLVTLREQVLASKKPSKIICVFGCGGGRDSGKRPLMGGIANRLSDFVIVTSDNPRHEDPVNIVNNVISSMDKGYLIELDRACAIHRAILSAGLDDIVLVAGKGHENYQEILGVKHPFSDEIIVLESLCQYQSLSTLETLQ